MKFYQASLKILEGPYGAFPYGDGFWSQKPWKSIFLCLLIATLIFSFLHGIPAWASGALPGEDASAKMESAGTLLRFIDTSIFKWGARILAGLCIFGAAWNLKEARFGPAIISVIAAILFGTAPTWVRNIFTIGGSDSVFSQLKVLPRQNTGKIKHV